MEDQITYQDVVTRLAPGGIDCERCVMNEEGRRGSTGESPRRPRY